MAAITVEPEALSRVLPMHVWLAADGTIRHAGPTLQKLLGDARAQGRRFFDLLEVRRPLGVESVAEMGAQSGRKLHLRLKDARKTTLKGIAIPLAQGDGVLLDLSLGISIIDAIGEFDLTAADFAPTDLTVEMLFLVEAKAAAMDAWRRLNTHLHGAKVAAEEQAYTDTLTGLKNRRAMDQILGRFVDAGEKFGLMHIDLDFFKDVNDTLGHAAGDHVLQEVARILTEETRSGDLAARVGGDEFVLLFHRLTDIDRVNDIAARIIARLEVPIPFGNELCRISASIGTSLSDRYTTPDVDRILNDADVALYASKHKGRACHTVYSDALRRDAAAAPTPADARTTRPDA